MITLRIDKQLENNVIQLAKTEGVSKSELIRKCIVEYIQHHNYNNAYESGKDVFEKYEFNDENLSVNSEEILRNRFKID